jgi:hypothetical protein
MAGDPLSTAVGVRRPDGALDELGVLAEALERLLAGEGLGLRLVADEVLADVEEIVRLGGGRLGEPAAGGGAWKSADPDAEAWSPMDLDVIRVARSAAGALQLQDLIQELEVPRIDRGVAHRGWIRIEFFARTRLRCVARRTLGAGACSFANSSATSLMSEQQRMNFSNSSAIEACAFPPWLGCGHAHLCACGEGALFGRGDEVMPSLAA